jgi:AcrR family transcriptional regulator
MTFMLDNRDTDTRCRIVAQAEAFFRQIGYTKTTVADIAKALKMSPANVYRFFESKKAINEAVADVMMRGVEEAAEAIAVSDASPPEKVRRFVETVSRMNAERYVEDRRMHEMVEAALDESWSIVEAHLGRLHAILTRIIAEGIARGDFDVDDAAEAAACVKAGMLKFCHPRHIIDCQGMEFGAQMDTMIRFMLRGLGWRPAR